MSDQVLLEILKTAGPLGLCVAAFGFYIRHLHAQLGTVQDSRVRDAQAVTERILQLVDRQHAQMDIVVTALNKNTEALRELRQLIADEVRGRRAG